MTDPSQAPGDEDYGYDPALDVGVQCPPVFVPATLPSSALVDPTYLPPVGTQGTTQHPGSPGTCAAWAAVYGLATFTAAKRTQSAPTSDELIASPAYIYLQVRKQLNDATPPCRGSSFKPYLDILAANGAANLQTAPYFTDCQSLTSYYSTNPTPPADSRFALTGATAVDTTNQNGLKQLLASNCAIAYGTRLYYGWNDYKGDPPIYYVTGANFIRNPLTGKLAGHCMLIIGYDDAKAAFKVQNSQGVGWGLSGYVWIQYVTFASLAQQVAFYFAE